MSKNPQSMTWEDYLASIKADNPVDANALLSPDAKKLFADKISRESPTMNDVKPNATKSVPCMHLLYQPALGEQEMLRVSYDRNPVSLQPETKDRAMYSDPYVDILDLMQPQLISPPEVGDSTNLKS